MPASLAGAVGLEPTISWLTARRIANYATPHNDLPYKFARVVPNNKMAQNCIPIQLIFITLNFFPHEMHFNSINT